MAAWYECSQCNREFLGPDLIPIEDDGVKPVCENCPPFYECGICGDGFRPEIYVLPDGSITTGNCDYCPPCYAREVVPIEEGMALDAKV